MKLLKLQLLLLAAICFTACKKDQAVINTKPQGPPTVVILGSSTAEGTGANPPDSSWARRLNAAVNEAGVKARFINLAFGGYSTYEVSPTGSSPVAGRPVPDTARNVSKALSYHPGLVIISLPSNDIAFNYTDDEILSNYAKITRALESAKVPYIIFSTQPRNFTDAGQRMRLKTINDKIKLVYTYHVNDFLDQLSTSTYSINPSYDAGDGIHVNDAGHRLIFNATMKQAIFISAVGQ